MTDKQIIIDDVDVSGCSYGEIEKSIFKCSCEYNVCSASMFCKDNPNCYYKQLKHKEQECEKAKQNAQDTYDLWQALIESFNILQGEKIKLEQECEELKQKIESYVCSANCYKYKKAEQYRIALEDIRGLINNPKNCVADIIYYSDKTAHDALQEGKNANIQS